MTTAWPPAESLPRPRIGEEEGELSALMRGMMNAHANDNGWPAFNGKFVEYPRFRKEWWAYRQTYHGHVRDELVCRSLKEKSLASHVRQMVNDIDDLREVWDTLDTCYDRPDKYISEALDPGCQVQGLQTVRQRGRPRILLSSPDRHDGGQEGRHARTSD